MLRCRVQKNGVRIGPYANAKWGCSQVLHQDETAGQNS